MSKDHDRRERPGPDAGGADARRRRHSHAPRSESALSRASGLMAGGQPEQAAEVLRAALGAGEVPPALEADARYLLGRILGASGDREGMAREWLAVSDLDAAADRPPRLSVREFEAAAEAALDELPQALIDELQGTAIIIVDRPSPDMVAGGIDPRILGLYHGVPMLKRSAMFGAPYADTIHLFRANLERVCPTREYLVERIRIVVLHETAHFFGYTEKQLREMGLA